MLGLEGTLYVISLNASVTDVETESWQDEKTWLQYTQLGGVGVVADLLELFPFCLLSSLLCSLGTKSTSLLLI